jgi:hypothetical protein
VSNRFRFGFALVAGLGFVLGAAARAEEAQSPEEIAAAVFALGVEVELGKLKLERDLTAYAGMEARRLELRETIGLLYARIAAKVREPGSEEEEESASLETLEADLAVAEQAEASARAELRRLRVRIADERERLRLLQDKLASLRRSLPQEIESVSGTWDVTLLPSGDRAVFILKQSGTLVSGEYTQEGGWKGSLQGTLVNNRILLHRIDSKLGPASELEGTVSSDLKVIRGTWQSRVLSDGAPSSGAWSGRKREARRKGDSGAS